MTIKNRIEWLEILLGHQVKDGRDTMAQALGSAIEDLRKQLPDKPDTIPVRIAVAVAPYEGNNPRYGFAIGAVGIDEIYDETTAREIAIHKVCDDPTQVIAQAIIEADIPMMSVVQAKVVEKSNGR